MSICELI